MTRDRTVALREKREEWLQWYEGDDYHAITKQIARMIWDTAAYRVINEARKHAPAAEEDGVQLNGMMHRLIDNGFFQSQALAIRRLVDKETSTGKRAVLSLWRLVNDIETNRDLFTRQDVLEAEGLEYDYETICHAWLENRMKEVPNGAPKATHVPKEYEWHLPEMRHQHMDKLAGVTADERKPSDRPRAGVFADLKDMLESCDEVVTYCHKFIAHAATPGSRAAADSDDEPSMTLAHLYQAHETLCKVANFVSVYLLGGAEQSFLAIPQYDQFRYIDRPLVEKGQVQRLVDAWDRYDHEVDEWRCAWEDAVLGGRPKADKKTQ